MTSTIDTVFGRRDRGFGHRAGSAAAALFTALLLAGCGGAQDGEPAEAGGDAGADTAGATAGAESAGALLNPNEASEDRIRSLPALTDSAAAAILGGRPFADVVGLDRALAAHMDSASRSELYREVWIPVDLNAGSDEAILLIPGVGDRMLHEFKEYRPYTAMAQFRGEIGKYVDDDEVARLERYVRLDGGT